MAYTLFLLMDPIGNIPLFISILKEIDRKRQQVIILRELFIALGVMIFFNYLGDALLKGLEIDQYTVLISGGIILFILALKMIFPSYKEPNVEGPREKEPLVVPLAIPLVAGPATLAMIMLYSRQEPNNYYLLAAIGIAWALSTIILLSAPALMRILGWRGIVATERLMGLLITMMAVQMFLQGITEYSSFLDAKH
jgi:multiple antibiotic resistance protein